MLTDILLHLGCPHRDQSDRHPFLNQATKQKLTHCSEKISRPDIESERLKMNKDVVHGIYVKGHLIISILDP